MPTGQNIINNLKVPPQHIYPKAILTPLCNLLQHYIDTHSKVMTVRFDLHFLKHYPIQYKNTHISETIHYATKKYKRHELDPMYFWVMEQKQSQHQHYHVALFLDAQKVRFYGHVFHTIEEAWGRSLGCDVKGCVHHCNVTNGHIDMYRNGLQIRRCEASDVMQEQIQNVLNQISYLAKDDTKNFDNDGMRNFGMSRLPKN